MQEVWEDIIGFERRYEISNAGRIKNTKSSRIRKASISNKGYLQISLRYYGKLETYYVHRLVLMAFVGIDDRQVNHKDGNKENNKIDNLEYCTASENIQHRLNILELKMPKGDSCGSTKIKDFQVEEMSNLDKNGVMRKDIAKAYCVSRGTVTYVLNTRAKRLNLNNSGV